MIRRLFERFIVWTFSLFARPLWRSAARIFRPVVVGPGESPEDVERERRGDRENGVALLVVVGVVVAELVWRW